MTVRPIFAALVAVVVLGGCGSPDTAPQAAPAATTSAAPVDETQFTRDGTFQSHINIDGVDFVYTLYPTKSTPRTHEWYPLGDKYFTVTLTAYDLDRKIRDPFSTKRKVYLDRINFSSNTDQDAEDGTSQQAYSRSAQARRITWDPEPLTKRGLGMLVTSPKGSFELRNQKIGSLDSATRLVTLHLSANVWIQRAPGSADYDRHTVKQDVPITIFASRMKTPYTEIPVDAN